MARRKPADGPEHQTWRMVIDWPHAHSHNEGGGPEEAQLIALLYRFLTIRRRARRCWSTTRHGCMDSDDGGENPSIAVRSSISGESRQVILEVTYYRARWASRTNGLQLRANGR
jgi:hypothetical protein